MNGRQLYFKEDASFAPIILLAMEDITEMIAVAERMYGHINKFEVNITKQTTHMELTIAELQRQIEELRKR